MSFRTRQKFTILSVLLTLLIPAAWLSQPASAASCPTLPTDKGTATTTFSVASAGTYRLWAHVYTPSSGSSAFDLTVDNGCPIDVGGNAPPAGAFGWLDSTEASAAAPITLTLASGTHTMTIAGRDGDVGVDQILLLTSSSCVPVSNGSNCEGSTPVVTNSTTTGTQAKPAVHAQKSHTKKLSGIKLTAYIATATVIAALVALVLLHYATAPNSPLKRMRPFKGKIQPQPQLADGLVPFISTPDIQAPSPFSSRKHKALFVLGFSIVGGLITFIALAATDYSIPVSLANATVSGQAQIVANASAINGHMVQFGSGAPPSPSKSTVKAPRPLATTPRTADAPSTPPSGSGSGSGTGSGSGGTGSGTGSAPGTLMSSVGCNYQIDTWSGDASKVGYSVTKLSGKDGNPASFSVKLNANKGTTEVVGYPSDQCIMYSALPANLTSSFANTPPAASTGLDYEYAYDIWLTTASAAQSNNWNNDLELMIWNYVSGQVPAGSVKATLSDGSKVWVAGNNSTGTVSVVLPKNETSGTVNIASIASQLKSLGYVNSSYNGILDVEYGIEAPYGGGQTFTVGSLSLSD